MKKFTDAIDRLLETPKEPQAQKPVKKETRATFIVEVELLEQVKKVAYIERITQKEVINAALRAYLEGYEKNKR